MSFASEILADNPFIYLPLDETSGTTATDRSGNARHGTYHGSPTLGAAGPGGLLAAQFNGSSQWVDTPSLDLTGTAVLTAECWLYWNSYVNDDDLAMELSSDINSQRGFFMDPNGSSGVWNATLSDGATYRVNNYSRGPLTAAAWHHVALVCDYGGSGAGQVLAYFDGSFLNRSSGAGGAPSGSFGNKVLYLMSRGGTALFGAGRMAQVALYPRALSAERIQAHRLGYVQQPTPFEHYVKILSPALYWPLDDAGSPFRDASGNGRTGVWANSGADRFVFRGRDPIVGSRTVQRGESGQFPYVQASGAAAAYEAALDVGTGDFAYMFACRFDAIGGNYGQICGRDTTAHGNLIYYDVSTGYVRLYFGNGSGIAATSKSVTDGNRHLVIVNRTSGIVTIEVDGTVVYGPTAIALGLEYTGNTAGRIFRIGTLDGSYEYPLGGYGHFAYWTRGLTAEERALLPLQARRAGLVL